MKENSEEDIKNIEEIIELSKEEIDAKDENITAILDIEDLISLEHILSDYKRVLKENEELKQDRNNNYQMIALAQNEALGYMQGYEDGKKLKRSAVANIVENQQYYIFNKQIEHYEEYIVKLQKENEELRKENTEFEKLSKDCSYSVDIVRENTRLRRQVFDLELENEKLKGQYAEYVKLTCNEVAKNSELNSELNSAIKEKK